MGRDWYKLGLLALVLANGCSGASSADEAEATEVATKFMPAALRRVVAKRDSAPEATLATDSLTRAREMEVMRETFAYQGGPRDPFNSLISGASSGPELADLQLVGVYEDLDNPANTVVILREKVGSKRHKMRVGDRIGRLRLVQIRSRDAVFMIQDLGYERQETLSLRKQEDATP